MQRFTISLEEKLAQDFDAWIAARAYANRSEAVRDLLRAELERDRRAQGRSAFCVACLSYVYNHHERDLAERLNAMQHAHHDLTVSTMHVHLDHEHCLETVTLRGATDEVQRFADAVCAERGVHHGRLNLISVDLQALSGTTHAHFTPAGAVGAPATGHGAQRKTGKAADVDHGHLHACAARARPLKPRR